EPMVLIETMVQVEPQQLIFHARINASGIATPKQSIKPAHGNFLALGSIVAGVIQVYTDARIVRDAVARARAYDEIIKGVLVQRCARAKIEVGIPAGLVPANSQSVNAVVKRPIQQALPAQAQLATAQH